MLVQKSRRISDYSFMEILKWTNKNEVKKKSRKEYENLDKYTKRYSCSEHLTASPSSLQNQKI